MHDPELGKLNRIAGQVEGVKKMIAERRYCPDILTQLRAIRAAIRSVEANVLETHLKSCVAESLASGNVEDAHRKIDELKDLFKRFDSE
jgi:CsoR family transcriptional regulator, copper-sensing transcriptional repressor